VTTTLAALSVLIVVVLASAVVVLALRVRALARTDTGSRSTDAGTRGSSRPVLPADLRPPPRALTAGTAIGSDVDDRRVLDPEVAAPAELAHLPALPPPANGGAAAPTGGTEVATVDRALPGLDMDALRAQIRTEIRRELEAELSALRLQATNEAAALRAEGEGMAAMARRLAEAEAEAMRRTAQAEVDNMRRALQAEAENSRRRAELEVSTMLLEGRRSAEREAAEIAESARRLKADLERREQRLAEREERLDSEQRRLEQRDQDLAEAERQLAAREADLQARTVEHERELERIAGLTAAEAKAELVRAVEAEARRDAAIIVRDIEAEARETAEQRARHIVTDAIQRVASEQTAESVVSVLQLPSDEMKGRIIGREGRNIRAFESVTGVNLIIDDTPEAVLLSCFDPVRREIGRVTLEKLVADGRIHPHRIEEVYERSKEEVERLCVRAGEDALVAVGITDIHPELVTLLGRLRYRTSYGQNVLKHLVETAHIAGIMAAELRLDRPLVKRCAFLHDIGKALTHEVEGSHALIGADVARRYGEAEEVVHAIEAHHNEVPPQTIEAVLTQAADACSGGRPGARRESLESYVKRLERIEEIASAREGVERVFAMQAGREVRVMVQPDQVDDLTAQIIAREVAKQIEDELTYPGQIRVTVVRESRATEIAR
jgi:ribonucrease Y